MLRCLGLPQPPGREEPVAGARRGLLGAICNWYRRPGSTTAKWVAAPKLPISLGCSPRLLCLCRGHGHCRHLRTEQTQLPTPSVLGACSCDARLFRGSSVHNRCLRADQFPVCRVLEEVEWGRLVCCCCGARVCTGPPSDSCIMALATRIDAVRHTHGRRLVQYSQPLCPREYRTAKENA